jgi:uncharacterized membrane protein YGL010W
MNATTQRRVDALFARYSGDHRNPVNQRIHVIAVPMILWTVVALLWCVPAGASWFRSGIWPRWPCSPPGAGTTGSRARSARHAGVLLLSACLCRLLEQRIGLGGLRVLALGLFAAAWVAQFVGHAIEGRRPSFLTDLTYLLVGPLWVLAKAYRALGWRT